MAKQKNNAAKANDEMAPERKATIAKIGELWKQLNDNKGNATVGRKTRRELRKLGHRGGLSVPPPVI